MLPTGQNGAPHESCDWGFNMTTNPIWVPAEEIEREVAGQTVPKQFLEIVGNHPDLVLLRSMQGETPDAWNERPSMRI